MQPNRATTSSADRQSTYRRRSLFLPGFAFGFLLIAILSCGGALFAVGLDSSGIADLRGRSGVAWTPPPVPTVVPPEESPVLPESEPEDDVAFRPGDRARNVTSSRVNVRISPGYLGKPRQDIVTQAMPGDMVEILDGPQTADGLRWWRVRLSGPGGEVEGWMAEATASGVQILGE